MDLNEKIKCSNTDCAKEIKRRDSRASVGGSPLCAAYFPMHLSRRFPTDPPVDNTPYCKCKRAGCKERFPIAMQKRGKMYCSQECQLSDIDPELVKLYGNARL
jgi:hypothetical protein